MKPLTRMKINTIFNYLKIINIVNQKKNNCIALVQF